MAIMLAESEKPQRSRVLRRWWWSVSVLTVCCVGSTIALVMFMTSAVDEHEPLELASTCGEDIVIDPDADLPEVSNYNREQMENAAIITAVGQDMEIPPRGWIIAVATAIQEASLHNLGHLGDRNDHDSLGLFQQRPSQGWGTPEEITDPVKSSELFYEKLEDVENWETMPLTQAAQVVQVSAFPDAYAKHEPDAVEIVNALTRGGARVSAVSSELGECAVGEISASGWIAPLDAEVNSGFRTATRPDHHGVDMAEQHGVPVTAAADGIVITSECNAYAPDGSDYSCDVDGSPEIQGCGWYVNVLHAGDILTRYCHFERAPEVEVGDQVQAGQVIGYIGSSGNSSGPHLHFEVHINADRSPAGAIDPVNFMNRMGAPLGS